MAAPRPLIVADRGVFFDLWSIDASLSLSLARAVAGFALSASPTLAQGNGTPIDVPTDPQARFWLIEGKRTSPTTVEVLTRREGPSGTSYALRQVDCAGSRFRYVGEGDTLADAKIRKTTDKMADLVTGSSAYYVSRFACATIK